MEVIGNKATVVAFVSAVGLMMIGCETSTSISAKETKPPIDVEMVPDQEPAMIDEITTLTVELAEKRNHFRTRKFFGGFTPSLMVA